jgi:hypothetical protein
VDKGAEVARHLGSGLRQPLHSRVTTSSAM